MTDNEIIKALECCSMFVTSAKCDECPLNEQECIQGLPWNALDLINRQKAEIERLEEILGGTSKVLTETCAVVRAEAIKEFLSKARELSYKSSDWSHGEHPIVIELDDLETICEEMVGEG